ncbi:MAG: putative bifunctional diguanylate cyclase/phosphodiesterase, partial [Acidimicrobiales bacterium]
AALANADLYEEGLYQRERLAAITASLAEGVCAVDRAGGLTFVNPAAAQLLGWEDAGIEPSRAHANRRHAPPFLFAPASRAMESGQVVRSDSAVFERRDGTLVPVAFTASVVVTEGRVAGAVIAFSDITERKAFEEELSHHAFHDELTGLANRRLFIDHLDHALSRSVRSNETHAVLFADIDRFKIVNDNLGHRAGDELLSALAERLGAAMRPGDMLARFGGDEFAVLLEGIRGLDDAVAVAERMAEQLLRPIVLDGSREVVSTLSVGIALTAPGKSRDDLLRDADVAMYEAKIRGRSGRCAVYDQAAMGARSAERFELEGALRKALERQELEVFYQPLFASEGEKLIGAEALVRWRHPEKGLLGPQDFISLAEETGLILPLGQFVLEQACRDSREWQDRHGLGLSTSVNLSPRQFQQHGLAENISSTLRAAGIDPRLICLEITETLIMEDVDHTVDVLSQLKQLGVRLAIDDFGTGYSSLGYLKKFPIDVVKIDRTFVDGLGANSVDTAIVASVIELAKALCMVTVAEGVETPAQLSKLRSLGCPVIQGYLLAEPMPRDAFAQLAADASREPLVPAV